MTHPPLHLAAFITPWLFYAGVGAVSIPLLIHLLAKRRFKRIRWAAVDFLLQAEKENRRKINLRELILLILRCLAMILIGLLLSRPFLQTSEWASGLGTSNPTEHIFLLDDSFSMGYLSVAQSDFAQAIDTLTKSLREISQASPGDRVSIFKTSDIQNPLLGAIPTDDPALTGVNQLLGQLQPSQSPASWNDVFVQFKDRYTTQKDSHPIALYAISDFQRTDWLGDSSGSFQVPPLKIFEQWQQEKKDVSLTLLPVGEPHRPNLAIIQFATPQPVLVADVENQFWVTVENFGPQPSQATTLNLCVQDIAQPAGRVPAIPAGQTASVIVNVPLVNQGAQGLRAEIPSDGLPLDDQRFLAVEVAPAIQVLIVNGEPSDQPLTDETTLIKTALDSHGEVSSGVQTQVVDESELMGITLENFHAVLLANVYRLNEETISRLEKFASQGGGLIIFAGDQLDPAAYNELLWKNGTGLSPCQLGSLLQMNEQSPVRLSEFDQAHPVLSVLASDGNPFLSHLQFWSFLDCVLSQNPEEEPSRSFPKVLARYDDPEQHPAIVEKFFGGGKVVLLTSSGDLEWNNWGRSPSYVVMMLELVQYLASKFSTHPDVIAGKNITLASNAQQYQPRARLRPPDYPISPETILIGQVGTDGQQISWSAGQAKQTGLYHWILSRTSQMEESRWLAVNPDATESNLSSCDESELRATAPAAAWKYIQDPLHLSPSREIHRQEFWPIVWTLVLVLLIVEHTLAWWFGRT